MRSAGGTAGLGAALAFAGLAFGSPSLIVPGLALVAVAVFAFVWVEASARGASIASEAGPNRIVEGDAYPLNLRLRRGPLPPPGGEVSDPLLAEPVKTGPLRPDRLEIEIRMPRRGRHVLAGAVWEIRDPLGLRSRVLAAPPRGELLVLPRIDARRGDGPCVGGWRGSGQCQRGGRGRRFDP